MASAVSQNGQVHRNIANCKEIKENIKDDNSTVNPTNIEDSSRVILIIRKAKY